MALGLGIMLCCLASSAVATNDAGIAYLAANKDKEGVIELPSGLQYKVVNKGEGKQVFLCQTT